MKNYISRPFFCDKSHNGATHKIVWGTDSQLFHYERIKGVIKENITPHIIKYKSVSGKIKLELTCGIVGCGCEVIKTENTHKLILKDVKKKIWSPKKWNALVNFKNTGYEV